VVTASSLHSHSHTPDLRQCRQYLNMSGLLEQLDGAISDLFQGWNIYSTALLVGILGFAGWVIANNADADTHPLLLARQAQASYVRQPRESAVFRSPETPHGCKSPRPPPSLLALS
jgi:hypothetical protein